MKVMYRAIDQKCRTLGRGRFSSYGRAFVAGRDRYGDRFSAVLVVPTGKVKSGSLPPREGGWREMPSWDAGR